VGPPPPPPPLRCNFHETETFFGQDPDSKLKIPVEEKIKSCYKTNYKIKRVL
jgi:hypothetical protein